MMRKLAFIATLIFISSCGYNGSYRYECQDPENWEKKECNPPLCQVDGACTETLLGFDPAKQGQPTETIPTVTTEETVVP